MCMGFLVGMSFEKRTRGTLFAGKSYLKLRPTATAYRMQLTLNVMPFGVLLYETI